MRSVFSMDGSQWVYGDAFGVTRLAVGKQAKLKHTSRVAAPLGGVSMDAAGTLALVEGRVQTGAYGSAGTTLVALPGLGLRERLSVPDGPLALMTGAAGDRVIRLLGDGLEVHALSGDRLVAERTIALGPLAARALDAVVLGPPGAGDHPGALCVLPDGRFAALATGVLYGGRVGGDAAGDEVWWALPVSILSTASVSLQVAGRTCWLMACDHAADVVRLAGVSPEGAVQTLERGSLGAPAVSETFVVTQPRSDVLTKLSLADGAEQDVDVGAWNAHPADAPEDGAFPRGRPLAPTRLPGHVALRGADVLFVPWHGEFVVDVARGAAHPRGLDVAAGPFRRLVVEEFARMNASLRALGLEATVAYFEPHPKRRSVNLGWHLAGGRRDLAGLLATQHVRDFLGRSELRTHGWSWGGFGGTDRAPDLDAPADLGSTHAGLAWMRANDLLPLEGADSLVDRYDRTMGIPFAATPSSLPFTPEGERLWVRAMLETIREGRWPDGGIPAAWATEPVTSALALDALAGLPRWQRSRTHYAIRVLARSLAFHLGAEAQPALLALLLAVGDGFGWKRYRDAGEALVWLCHGHPELRDPSLAALEGAGHSDDPVGSHELGVVREALARGAKHLWSNG